MKINRNLQKAEKPSKQTHSSKPESKSEHKNSLLSPKDNHPKKPQKQSKSISNQPRKQNQKTGSKEEGRPKLKIAKYLDFSYLNEYNIEIISRIGKGGYGVVYKGIRNEQLVAVKVNFQTISFQTQFGELAILKILSGSEHTSKLIEIINVNEKIHIVSAFVEHQHSLSYFQTFEPNHIKHYMRSLLLGLKELKQHGIIHKDIKPSNFLYNPVERKGVLIDFGASVIDESFGSNKVSSLKQGSEEQQLYISLLKTQQAQGRRYGTNGYSPLEILLKQQPSYSVDIWSAGVIFLQFLVKKYLIFNNFIKRKELSTQNSFLCSFLMELAQIFGGEDVVKICERYNYELKLPLFAAKIPLGKIIKREIYGDECIDLISQMLVLVPEDRISIEDALAHPYFHDIMPN